MEAATVAVEAVVSTAVEVEVFTEAVAGDFMAAAVIMAAEVLAAEDTPVTLAATPIADIVADTAAEDIAAATTVVTATMAATVMVGEAEAGAMADTVTEEDTVTDGEVGAGDLALAGLIGDMAGDIRMATTAIRITRPIPIRILPTDIPRTP
jgi:hypothetical protein